MCEPVYYNTCPTEIHATTEFGDVLTGTKLNEAIIDVQRSLKRSEPAKELVDKYRWMVIDIINESQFPLKYEKEWFDVGRFWDAPSNVAAFSHSCFSGCNTLWGAAGCHGVSGAVLFSIQIPDQVETFPVSIAFSNPGTGCIKTRAEFSQDMQEVWKRMDEQCTYSAELDIGSQHLKFKLVSTPGNQAMVTLTQVCEMDDIEINFLDRAKLSETIGKSQHHLSASLQPAKKLKEKYRWIVINVANETQFSLKYEEEWFDFGRFWDAPRNIAPFSQASFSGCSTYWGAAGYHGVSGSVLFYLQIPGQLKQHPITIAFSNPGAGSIKTRADFSCDMKEVWKRMDKQCTHNTEIDISIQQIILKFHLTSTPGSQAKVTLTQA